MHPLFRLTTAFAILFLLAAATVPAAVRFSEKAPVDLHQCWRSQDDEGFISIASAAKRVFGVTASARVVALSALTGDRLWSVELGGVPAAEMVAGVAGLLVVSRSSTAAGSAKTSLRLLSFETGIPSRSAELPLAEKYFLQELNGSVIIATSAGHVLSLDAVTLETKWDRKPVGAIDGANISANGIVLISGEGQVLVLSPQAGEVVSVFKTIGKPVAVLGIGSDKVIYSDERGNIVSAASGRGFKAGARADTLWMINDRVLVTSFDNFIYLLTPSGSVEWKRRLGGRPAGVAFTDDKRLLAFALGTASAVLLDIRSGKIVGGLILPESANFVRLPAAPGSNTFLLNGDIIGYSIGPCKIKGDTQE